MKQDRKRFLKDLNDTLRTRYAAAIERLHLRIYKAHWAQGIEEAIANNTSPDNPDIDKFIATSTDKYWKDIIRVTREWGKKHNKSSNRARTWLVTSVRHEKKGTVNEHIHVYATFIPATALRKHAKRSAKTSGTVRGRKKWYANCTNSWKRMIRKWADSQSKKITTEIVMEHGKYPDYMQEPSELPGGASSDLPYPAGRGPRSGKTEPELSGATDERMNPRTRARGNNLETSLIQTLSNLGGYSNEGIEYLVEQVANFIGLKFRSELIKTRDKNRLRRNHTIYITPVLMSSGIPKQKGTEDKKDIELMRDIISKNLDNTNMAFLLDKGHVKLGSKKFDDMMSASPTFTDDIDGFTEEQLDKMLESAERHFRKRKAQDNVKTKIKKEGFRSKLEALRKKQKDTIELKEAAKPIVAKIASFRGKNAGKGKKKPKVRAAGLSSINRSQRSKALRDSGITQGKEGMLITEMINNVLHRAVLKNMGAPGLINRTGTFARKAEVLQTLVGPRGGLYVDYAYPREPYGVFEPGQGKRPWSNQYRDPRRIIGASIREIIQKRMVKHGLGGASAVLTRKFS